MERLDAEYMDILKQDKNASDKFWELEKRIKCDVRKTGVLAHDVSRSNMYGLLLDEGAITMDDLSGFSEDLKVW